MVSCLKSTGPLFASQFSLIFSPPKHQPFKLPLSFNTRFRSLKMSTVAAATQTTVEHVVLFKVKDNTEPTQVNSMITSLNALISLEPVRHLTAGALHRTKSSPFPFTHMLHSRYSSPEDLNAYAVHPDHVAVVKGNVLPTCDDVMAIDWVADNFDGPLVLSPGSAIRLSFLKLKENLGAEVKDEILGVIKEIKDKFGGIDQITCGENFSTRAKGYSIASLAVFPGVSEMEAADSKEDLVNLQKQKVRDYLESVIVLDYVVPPSQSPSL